MFHITRKFNIESGMDSFYDCHDAVKHLELPNYDLKCNEKTLEQLHNIDTAVPSNYTCHNF